MSRQAFALDVLVNEVNHHAPGRNKASDGGIGDVAHQHQVSDHNPNAAGVWRAFDFTNDPHHLPGHDLATRLERLIGKHPAMMSGAYIIWDHHIISHDRHGEGWRSYSGDPHTSHVHLSVSTDAHGYDSRQPWHLFANPPAQAHPYEAARRYVQLAVSLIADKVPTDRTAAHAFGHELNKLLHDSQFPPK